MFWYFLTSVFDSSVVTLVDVAITAIQVLFYYWCLEGSSVLKCALFQLPVCITLLLLTSSYCWHLILNFQIHIIWCCNLLQLHVQLDVYIINVTIEIHVYYFFIYIIVTHFIKSYGEQQHNERKDTLCLKK